MPEKSLAIVPNGGYDIGKCGSLKENTWLVYFDKQNEKEEGPNLVLIRSRYCSGLAQKAVGRFFSMVLEFCLMGVGNVMNFMGAIITAVHTAFQIVQKLFGVNVENTGIIQLKWHIKIQQRENWR